MGRERDPHRGDTSDVRKLVNDRAGHNTEGLVPKPGFFPLSNCFSESMCPFASCNYVPIICLDKSS